MRKLRDQIYALLLEVRLSKEEILTEYLNLLYFGNGIYGIANAAAEIFHTTCQQITIAQAATLAAIIQRPGLFNPQYNSEKCRLRRNLILKRMHINGFITKEAYEAACREPIPLFTEKAPPHELSFLVTVNDFLKKSVIKKEKGPLYVFTNFSSKIQKVAEEIFYDKFTAIKKRAPRANGAMVVVENTTGKVKAIIHGSGFYKNDRRRALQCTHAIGSILKPLIAAYAFLKGDTPTTIYTDEPLLMNGWAPKNNNKVFKGPMSIEKAIIESNNIVPIKILLTHGISPFITLLNNLHCFPRVPPYYAVALGCFEASALMISQYATMFSGHGIMSAPTLIRSISNEEREIIYRAKNDHRESLPPSIILPVCTILEKNARVLLKKNHITTDRIIGGKTGTSEGRAFWFFGYNEKYTVVVFIGADTYENLYQQGVRSGKDAAFIGLSFLATVPYM